MRISRRINKLVKTLFKWVLLPGKILNRTFSKFFRLVVSWWNDRQLKHLFWGTPALFVGVGSLFLLLIAGSQSKNVKADAYLEAAQSSMNRNSLDAAKLYFERALELEPGNYEAMFKLAQVADASGDEQRVAPIMDQLAPTDHPVYTAAHLWKAKWHFTHPEPDQAHFKAAENQLQLALQLDTDNLEANILLGELYYTRGALTEPPDLQLVDQSIHHLSQAVGDSRVRLEYTLLLARAYARANDEISAKRYGEIALAAFEEQVRQNPDDSEALFNLADTAMFLERYPEAVDLLKKILKVQDALHVRLGLAKVCVAWSDTMDRATITGRQKCFQLLTAALSAYPNEMSIFDRMLSLLMDDQDLSEQAQVELLDNITNGHAIAMSHLILGVLAFEGQKQSDAEFHLQKAYEQLPDAPIIINNLAWYMSHGDKPNYEQNLSMINILVQRFPTNQVYRDTRGYILLKMGRPEEAITDLEIALQTHAGNAETHASLAEAYQLLGMEELALRHQRAAIKANEQSAVPLGEIDKRQKTSE